MNKTRYRTVSNGYWELLQYEVVKTYTVGFWFFKKTIEKRNWYYVPRPYYDEIWGRSLDCVLSDTVINSLNTNLDQFVKDYPDINDWFKVYDKKQTKLVEQVKEKRAARAEREKKVRYFDE